MVRNIIDIAITQHKPLDITYCKDGINIKDFNLRNVIYSRQYGSNYISGFSESHKSELVFRIDKIIQADIEWVEIYGKESIAMKDGLYQLMCMGDMHLEFELRKYKRGDDLQASYQNDEGVQSCRFSDDILAYHYIPFYLHKEQKEWIPFEKNNVERKSGFYTFAYLLIDGTSKKEDEYCRNGDDGEEWVDTNEFLSPWELTNTKENGIHYTVDVLGCPFDKLRIPHNIHVLGYNYCSCYTEKDHENHWKLAKELFLCNNSIN